jgi:hypothetical protein
MNKSQLRKLIVGVILVLMLTIGGGVQADGPVTGGGYCSGSWCSGG